MKKALLIGINYTGTSSQLSGCINDAHNMKAFLENHGYTDFKVLTDHAGHSTSDAPTFSNILTGLRWLVHGAKTEDHLLVHYSGHGTQVQDRNGDEEDGRDEAWCPLDYTKLGMITDDTIKSIIGHSPAKVLVVSDCCHSGTILDLRVNYLQSGRREMVVRENPKVKAQANQVVCISGCLDNQTSADTVAPKVYGSGSQAQGAMTWTLLKALKNNPGASYRRLLKDMWIHLADNGYSQKPQLTASHHLDLNAPLEFF